MEQTTRPQNENVFAEVKEYLIDKVNGKINNEFDLLEKLHLGKYNNIVEHLKNERIFDNDISEIEDFKNRKNIVGLTNEQVQEKIQNLKGEINGEQTADNSETIRQIRADIENYETQLSNREKGIPETILKAKFEDIPPYKIGEKITDFIDRKVEDWGLKNDFEKLKSLQIDNIFEKNINLDEFKENLVNRIKSQNSEFKETQQENVQNFIGKMVFSDHGKTQTELDKERLQEYKNLTPEEKNMVKEMGVREAINLIEEVGEKTISQEGIKKTQEHFERIINEAEKEQTTKQEEKIKSPIESAQLDYLKNQLKYLGFGESNKLHQDLEKGINSNEKTFKIQTQSDRAMQGNEVNFTLNFNKSEKGGVFLNSFNATLKNEIGEERTHNFGVNHFTAKEAVNLLEGRSVKTEFKENEPVFVKLNFAEEKNEYGNFKFQTYNQQAYGVDTAKIVEKSGLIFDKPEHKDNTVKSLEKGNIVKVKFNLDNKITEGNAVLNPQYKTLNLYDKEMNRLNTNKPIQGLDTQQQEKNNIRQQNISRSL
jgi:hypothetical protein